MNCLTDHFRVIHFLGLIYQQFLFKWHNQCIWCKWEKSIILLGTKSVAESNFNHKITVFSVIVIKNPFCTHSFVGNRCEFCCNSIIIDIFHKWNPPRTYILAHNFILIVMCIWADVNIVLQWILFPFAKCLNFNFNFNLFVVWLCLMLIQSMLNITIISYFVVVAMILYIQVKFHVEFVLVVRVFGIKNVWICLFLSMECVLISLIHCWYFIVGSLDKHVLKTVFNLLNSLEFDKREARKFVFHIRNVIF